LETSLAIVEDLLNLQPNLLEENGEFEVLALASWSCFNLFAAIKSDAWGVLPLISGFPIDFAECMIVRCSVFYCITSNVVLILYIGKDTFLRRILEYLTNLVSSPPFHLEESDSSSTGRITVFEGEEFAPLRVDSETSSVLSILCTVVR